MGNKEKIREEIKLLKKQLGQEDRQSKSADIVSHIEQSGIFQSAKTVLLFSPLPDEPDISPLLVRYAKAKRVILPVVVGDNLILRQLYDLGSMSIGAFGIKEPSVGEFNDYSSIDLALIPGVAFDLLGNRTGRGKGYYDKLLCDDRFSNVLKIGCAFGFQILENVPTRAHDVKMDGVVYESEIRFL